uniref:Gustatory receptor n=1 Tax=Lutzomyia longipalpis TaxID=7200 RepID=A0A3F2ZD95_LUTLO
MSLEQLLGVHLTLQKWITIPNYPVKGKAFSKIILILRFIVIILFFNIVVFHDIYILFTQPNYNFFGDQTTLSLALSEMNGLFIKISVLATQYVTFFKNKSHRKIIKDFSEFIDEFDGLFSNRVKYSCFRLGNVEPILVIAFTFLSHISYSFHIPKELRSYTGIWMFYAVLHRTISDLTVLYILNYLRIYQNYIGILMWNIERRKIGRNISISDLFQKFQNILNLFKITFSFVINFNLIHHFFEGTIASYFGIYRFFGHALDSTQFNYTLTFTLWIFRSAFILYKISLICGDFSQQNKKLIRSIDKLTDKKDFMVLERSIGINVNQIILKNFHDNPSVTALNTYSIDHMIFFTIFSSIASNVFILLQFKMIEDDDS